MVVCVCNVDPAVPFTGDPERVLESGRFKRPIPITKNKQSFAHCCLNRLAAEIYSPHCRNLTICNKKIISRYREAAWLRELGFFKRAIYNAFIAAACKWSYLVGLYLVCPYLMQAGHSDKNKAAFICKIPRRAQLGCLAILYRLDPVPLPPVACERLDCP